MSKILVVEDDPQLSGVVRDWLTAENHAIDVVNNGQDAWDLLRAYQFDLVVLDWELPELSGPEVCRMLRAANNATPVLMLTGRQQVDDRITGLDAGADDYLTKPFALGELSARVRALLRRPAAAVVSTTLKVGDLVVETDKFRVFLNGSEVYLLPKEFALLAFLMKHPGQVFSSEALVNRVWPSDSEASPDAVKTHVNRLRKKLDREGKPSVLRTIHGMGYKLDG